MRSLNTVDWVALVLVLVGGLNWGLIAIANFDLVATLFGDGSALARIVYGLVGIATLYIAVISPKLGVK